MKQSLVLLLACMIHLSCFGQTQEDSVVLALREGATESPAPKSGSEKVQYEKFVMLSVRDFNILINSLNRVKELEMYNPRVSDKEKVDNFKWIGDYLDDLEKRIKVDSAVVTKPQNK